MAEIVESSLPQSRSIKKTMELVRNYSPIEGLTSLLPRFVVIASNKARRDQPPNARYSPVSSASTPGRHWSPD